MNDISEHPIPTLQSKALPAQPTPQNPQHPNWSADDIRNYEALALLIRENGINPMQKGVLAELQNIQKVMDRKTDAYQTPGDYRQIDQSFRKMQKALGISEPQIMPLSEVIPAPKGVKTTKPIHAAPMI